MVVYRIAKRNMKNRTITCSRIIFGSDRPRDTMATLRFLSLAMSLSGRRIFNILKALMKEIYMASPAMTPSKAETTITKSSMFQGSRM